MQVNRLPPSMWCYPEPLRDVECVYRLSTPLAHCYKSQTGFCRACRHGNERSSAESTRPRRSPRLPVKLRGSARRSPGGEGELLRRLGHLGQNEHLIAQARRDSSCRSFDQSFPPKLMPMDGSVLTAVIAAAASVMAAVVAAVSARSASKTSTRIAALQHGIVEVDMVAAELKQAYDNFTKATYNLGSNPEGFHAALAALTALRGCAGASQELKDLCEENIRLAHDLERGISAPQSAFRNGGYSARFRTAYDRNQEALSAKRRDLLSKHV